MPDWIARKPPDLKNCTTGPVRLLVISTMVWPDAVELPGRDKVLVQSATPGVADRWATAFRAPAPSTGSSVSR